MLSSSIAPPLPGQGSQRQLLVSLPGLASVGLFAVIFFLNIVDVITSIQLMKGNDFTMGQLVKSLLFISLFLYNLKQLKRCPNLVFLYLLFFYMVLVEIVNFFHHYQLPFLVKGLGIVTKTLLPFYLYYCLVGLARRNLLSTPVLMSSFYFCSFLFGMTIIVPVVMGVSFTSYSTSGFTGLYNAGNEIGGFVTVSFPILLGAFLSCQRLGQRVLMAVLLGCVLVGGGLTGAKTPILAAGLSVLLLPPLLSKARLVLLPLVVSLAAGLAWWLFANLRTIAEALPEQVYGRLIYTIMSRVDIVDVLLGVRLEYLRQYLNEFARLDPFSFLFGKGYMYGMEFMVHYVGLYKTAEMDGLDFFARYGLLGILMVAVILVYTLVTNLQRQSRLSLAMTYMLLLLIANALLAGHILGNAFPAVILGILFAVNRLEIIRMQQGAYR